MEWDYPKFHLTMHCFLCEVVNGGLTLLEHEAARWLTKEQLGLGEMVACRRGGGQQMFAEMNVLLL